jgi:protein-disulfide isomerase
LLATLSWPGSVPAHAAFTAEQREEITAILREALKQDPSILRDAITALQADEGAREQAAAKAAIATTKDALVNASDPVAGNPKGDVTIVEFFDVRCGYCRRLEPVMAQFLAQDRNVRLVYKDLPILGPGSVLASKALLAAQKQNAYEKLRDALMKVPPDISKASLQAEVTRLGLDWTRLSHDMDDPVIQQRIDANLSLAQVLNIQGTPAMVIGDELIPGAVGLAELKRTVDAVRSAKR